MTLEKSWKDITASSPNQQMPCTWRVCHVPATKKLQRCEKKHHAGGKAGKASLY